MRDKTKTKQAKAKKASKFITLPDGSLLRKSNVVMVEPEAGTVDPRNKRKVEARPRVFVYYGHGNDLRAKVLTFESDVEQRVCMNLIRHSLV